MSAELSIIVPCRNDGAVLTAMLEELHQVVAHHSMSVETLIVDDGSDDDTVEIATRAAHQFPVLHVRVLVRKHLQFGLGGVLRYGMAFALGRHCVLLLPDGEDPIDLLPTFLVHLRGGNHLVQVSRYLRPGDADDVPASYRFWQTVYRGLARLLVGTDASDTTNSFCAFDRVFVQALGLTSRRFSVCAELAFKIGLCGGVVQYVPGKPRKPRPGTPHFYRPMVEVWSYIYVLLRAALHRVGLMRWF